MRYLYRSSIYFINILTKIFTFSFLLTLSLLACELWYSGENNTLICQQANTHQTTSIEMGGRVCALTVTPIKNNLLAAVITWDKKGLYHGKYILVDSKSKTILHTQDNLCKQKHDFNSSLDNNFGQYWIKKFLVKDSTIFVLCPPYLAKINEHTLLQEKVIDLMDEWPRNVIQYDSGFFITFFDKIYHIDTNAKAILWKTKATSQEIIPWQNSLFIINHPDSKLRNASVCKINFSSGKSKRIIKELDYFLRAAIRYQNYLLGSIEERYSSKNIHSFKEEGSSICFIHPKTWKIIQKFSFQPVKHFLFTVESLVYAQLLDNDLIAFNPNDGHIFYKFPLSHEISLLLKDYRFVGWRIEFQLTKDTLFIKSRERILQVDLTTGRQVNSTELLQPLKANIVVCEMLKPYTIRTFQKYLSGVLKILTPKKTFFENHILPYADITFLLSKKRARDFIL